MLRKSCTVSIAPSKKVLYLLSHLAKHKNQSLSTLVKELVLEALDHREDKVLSSIAKKRDTKRAKRVSHLNAFKTRQW
jgi:hypothetical protein